MNFLKVLLTVFAVLVLGVVALFMAASQLDTVERPAPELNPGYLVTEVEVAHREADEARLQTFLWYPVADAGAEPSLHAQNALFYGFHAIENTTPADGPLPVVLLSHGSGGNGPHLGWIARDLAMRGFIVLSVNHPGTTSGDSDPHRTPHIWERTQDFRAVLDWLLETPPAGLTPDPARVASAGFSLGGHAALALGGARVSKQAFITYCDEFPDKIDCGWMNAAGVDFEAIDAARYEADLSDPRVIATVAVDPALPRAMTTESLTAMTRPALLITLGRLDAVPAAMNPSPILAHLPNARLHETRAAWHFSFLADCSPLGRIIIGAVEDENICDDPIARTRSDVHEELRPVIGDFLAEVFAL
ncbi:MAG: CocE/NonD family hydrolase [Pseudomonadota bacterium]